MNHTLPRWMDLGLLPALNLAMALVGASVVVWAIGLEPLQVIGLLVKGAWGSASGISYTLYYSTTFVFTGLAVAVAFHLVEKHRCLALPALRVDEAAVVWVAVRQVPALGFPLAAVLLAPKRDGVFGGERLAAALEFHQRVRRAEHQQEWHGT